MSCRTITADPDALHPHRLGRKTAAEIGRIEADNAERVDCAGTGVTIVSQTWAVHPDDDDGALTLDQDAISGLVCSVRVTGGTSGVDYRLVHTVNTSDGLALELTYLLPVLDTAAAA